MTRTCDLRFRNAQGRMAVSADEYDSIGVSAVACGRLSYLVTGCIRRFGSKLGPNTRNPPAMTDTGLGPCRDGVHPDGVVFDRRAGQRRHQHCDAVGVRGIIRHALPPHQNHLRRDARQRRSRHSDLLRGLTLQPLNRAQRRRMAR